MTTAFKKAVKHESKLRLAIAGPSGSGKTYTALAVASGLGSRIAVVDTEHGSASKYADLFDFDVLELTAPFHPDRFVEAIQAAGSAGYDVLILDSLSHAWNGQGGLLDVVEEIARRMKTSNTFAAWKDATPIQNRMIEAIVGAPLHIIGTMRSKQEYVLETVDKGGRTITVPRKVGMAPIQRDSMEYEFDVYLDMDIENNGIVQKTRCPALAGRVMPKPGADLADILREWLSGEEPPDYRAVALEATTPAAFAAAAWRLNGSRVAFASAERLTDWVNYVSNGAGYQPERNAALLLTLDSYCKAVGDGTPVRAAAEKAREAVQAAIDEATGKESMLMHEAIKRDFDRADEEDPAPLFPDEDGLGGAYQE